MHAGLDSVRIAIKEQGVIRQRPNKQGMVVMGRTPLSFPNFAGEGAHGRLELLALHLIAVRIISQDKLG